MIQHTVAFRLKESADADTFLARARRLSSIEAVHDFEVLRQIGSKSDFTHALSMRFDGQTEYDVYNEHADHVAFVTDVWIPNVAEFLELDYIVADS